MSGRAFLLLHPWQKPTKGLRKRARWRPKPWFRSSVSLEDWHNVAFVRPSWKPFEFYVGLGLIIRLTILPLGLVLWLGGRVRAVGGGSGGLRGSLGVRVGSLGRCFSCSSEYLLRYPRFPELFQIQSKVRTRSGIHDLQSSFILPACVLCS